MKFDASLQQRWEDSDGAWRFEMPSGWLQGRSVFGGLSAAALAALAQRIVEPERVLRTLNIQLLRPTLPGWIPGSARVVREGKSTSFVQASLGTQGEETALASMVFMRPRDSTASVAAAPPFTPRDIESLPNLPYLPGVTPEFTQNIALRWASGGPPFSGAERASFEGYCRFRVPAGDVQGVLGLLDMWPCPSLSVLSERAFASTVTWTAHIFSVPEDFEQWFSFSYETVAGQNGMHTSVGHLHAADGTYVGFTEQLVAIFS